MLTHPAARSVLATILPHREIEGYIEWGKASGDYSIGRSRPAVFPAGKPATVKLEGLAANARYYYRLRHRLAGSDEWLAGTERSFHTCRERGAPFVFVVQSDSHSGEAQHCDPRLYRETLLNEAAAGPDFAVDLGDTFPADRIAAPSEEKVRSLYAAHHAALSLVCDSAPLFLTVGNHEGATWWLRLSGSPLPAWAVRARRDFFPNPVPGDFYGGNEFHDETIGRLDNYYSWEWGDALFVILDPWWHRAGDAGAGAMSRRAAGPWSFTLGERQYRWLAKTLARSTAPWKFVFSHNVTALVEGGVAGAEFWEWGGKEPARRDMYDWGASATAFAGNRPGWEMPIHRVLAENGVTITFLGHEHFFAVREMDGVIYQICPMAADPSSESLPAAGRKGWVVLGNSGHLRVSVRREDVSVEYVRSRLHRGKEERKNAEVAWRYFVPERQRGGRRRGIRGRFAGAQIRAACCSGKPPAPYHVDVGGRTGRRAPGP
ncbi:MAG: metallophosphoesterase [Planctomycetota bacterium]|nr:metallophosphoesterase [Planctomycetota bacterium]